LRHFGFSRLIRDEPDVDRARRRGFTIGKQQADGMSEVRGLLDPEARATLDAVLAKQAAPGMCNPDDDSVASESSLVIMRLPTSSDHSTRNSR
jgi:hypothetical protein